MIEILVFLVGKGGGELEEGVIYLVFLEVRGGRVKNCLYFDLEWNVYKINLVLLILFIFVVKLKILLY